MPWFWSVFETAVDGSPRRVALGLVLDSQPRPRHLVDQRQARARDIHTGGMGYICILVAPPSSVVLKRRHPRNLIIFEEGPWRVCLQKIRLRDAELALLRAFLGLRPLQPGIQCHICLRSYQGSCAS